MSHWAVSVERDGENIVTIESNMLSGRDISPEDAETIRLAALNLLSFIGASALEEATNNPARPVDGEGQGVAAPQENGQASETGTALGSATNEPEVIKRSGGPHPLQALYASPEFQRDWKMMQERESSALRAGPGVREPQQTKEGHTRMDKPANSDGAATAPTDDDYPTISCPVCADVTTDLDGFGFMACAVCGYCTHPSRTGNVCGICGDVEPEANL